VLMTSSSPQWSSTWPSRSMKSDADDAVRSRQRTLAPTCMPDECFTDDAYLVGFGSASGNDNNSAVLAHVRGALGNERGRWRALHRLSRSEFGDVAVSGWERVYHDAGAHARSDSQCVHHLV
jgi:hypothetical protein